MFLVCCAYFAVFAFGEVRLGASVGLVYPGFGSVQPSEFMKIAMPMAARMDFVQSIPSHLL